MVSESGVHPLDHAGCTALEAPAFGEVVGDLGQHLVGRDDLDRLERPAQRDRTGAGLVARKGG